MTLHLIFENYDSFLEALDVDSLLVSHFFFSYQLLFEPHFLVYNLLLDRGFDTFESDIIADSFLVPLIDQVSFKITYLELKSHIFV